MNVSEDHIVFTAKTLWLRYMRPNRDKKLTAPLRDVDIRHLQRIITSRAKQQQQ